MDSVVTSGHLHNLLTFNISS